MGQLVREDEAVHGLALDAGADDNQACSPGAAARAEDRGLLEAVAKNEDVEAALHQPRQSAHRSLAFGEQGTHLERARVTGAVRVPHGRGLRVEAFREPLDAQEVTEQRERLGLLESLSERLAVLGGQ
jgi:hypothetical protein